MSVSSQQLVDHYARHAVEAQGLVAQTQALLEHVRSEREAVVEEQGRAWGALAVAYVPVLEPAFVHRAEKLTGFRGFSRRDPFAALAQQLASLKKAAARIQSDERYRRRQFLVGPHGELTRELAERTSLLEPWETECTRFESQESFFQLLDARYDTPEFDVGFFSAQYWKLWAAGDRICEELGLADFGDDVLPAFKKAASERLKWCAQVKEVQDEIDAVHELVRQHDLAVQRQPLLPGEVLDASRQALAAHLAHADMGLLEQWLGEEPDRSLLVAMRRAAGLSAKGEALDDMISGLVAQEQDLAARGAKYQRKRTKYDRSKYRYQDFSQSDMDRKFGAKSKKMREALKKDRVLVDRLVRYDHYDRFALSNEPELWWFEFTRKRPPRHCRDLRRWYDANPERTPQLDVDEAEQRAVAKAVALQNDAEDVGYIS
ncbi:MAG: hypothetical protein GY913_01845 [Proteobacteria bacterium]|nr:hypothetical protein [Pseudomonadota bacterium]MCP4915643.1 hypothetical protein [Pseudomonadota bacterium]